MNDIKFLIRYAKKMFREYTDSDYIESIRYLRENPYDLCINMAINSFVSHSIREYGYERPLVERISLKIFGRIQ